jgi:hypothetical protein
MPLPQNQPLPLVATLINSFDDETRQTFDVQTTAIQQAGGITHGHAECLALLSILHTRPTLLTGLSVLAMTLDGATQWVLTSDVIYARQQLEEAGATDLEEIDPALVIRRQYNDLAMLSTFG